MGRTTIPDIARKAGGELLAFSACWPGTEHRVDFLRDRRQEYQYLDPRGQEILGVTGITAWEHLEKIESAQLTLDVDGYSPGTSGNLIARIPGADSSKAVILGAHIDSPNTPGVFDDGSGSAASSLSSSW